MRTVLLCLLAGAALAGLPAASPATVPPRDCGIMEIGAKRWQVKADQLPCRRARRYARIYVRTRDVPSPYSCRRGPRGSALFALCTARSYNPDRVIHIIRRSS